MVKYLDRLRGITRKPLFQVVAITLIVIFISASLVAYFEGMRGDSNIDSIWDGIWWSVVTIGTVRYGDKYPVSSAGRVIGMLLIFCGIGLMSVFTATIASIFVERRMKEGRGLDTIKDKDHGVICGWNQHTDEVLLALARSGIMGQSSIVLINELSVDEIDALRLKYGKFNLKFLRGNYVHEDVLLRANIFKARFALLMADLSGQHARERIDERTTLTALTIRSIAPNVKIIAELLDQENKPHLKRANVNDIIVRGEHVGSLLATAVMSPGLPKVFSSLLAASDTNRLWRADIPHFLLGKTFIDAARYYREKYHAILIGLLREKKAMKLDDILSDNTSVIDNFIKEKLRESRKDFYLEKDDAHLAINPKDDTVIGPDDYAVVLSKDAPK